MAEDEKNNHHTMKKIHDEKGNLNRYYLFFFSLMTIKIQEYFY